MSDLTLSSIAAQIRGHHREASLFASTAIKHAVGAGELLTDVKAKLPHGEFGMWVARECGFSYRMARKYMLAAKRLGALPESNWPAGASLNDALAIGAPATTILRPSWLPVVGRAVTCHDGRGRVWCAWALDYIDCDGVRQDKFAAAMVSTETDGGVAFYEYAPRGIRLDYLAVLLKIWGLDQPNDARWSDVDAGELVGVHAELTRLDGVQRRARWMSRERG